MATQAIDNVGLAVSSMEESLRFYQALGFEPEYHDASGVLIVAGEARLYLFPAANTTSVSRNCDLVENPVGIDHISLKVDNIDALCHLLESQGISLASPLQTQEWGPRAACVRDPDGNCIWLLQEKVK